MKVVDEVWLYASVAVQVSVVVPRGKVEPDVSNPLWSAQDTVSGAPYWSVAVGAVHDSAALPAGVVAVPVIPVGVPVIVGGIVPAPTVSMFEVPDPVFPDPSDTKTANAQFAEGVVDT
jgi:hypothetical protein